MVRETEQWVKVEALVELGTSNDQEDRWVIYPYSVDEGDVYLDDIRYEIITLKKE